MNNYEFLNNLKKIKRKFLSHEEKKRLVVELTEAEFSRNRITNELRLPFKELLQIESDMKKYISKDFPGLSTHVINCLKSANIVNEDQAIIAIKTGSIKKIRNFGEKAYSELCNYLKIPLNEKKK